MAEMQFGLMVRAQFPRGDDMQARVRELVEQARLAVGQRAGLAMGELIVDGVEAHLGLATVRGAAPSTPSAAR